MAADRCQWGCAHRSWPRRSASSNCAPASGGKKRTLDVKSDEPIDVEFYRAWADKRKLTGELIDGGQPFVPSTSATVTAWTPRPSGVPVQHAARLLNDGKFEIEFDDERASVLFFDSERKRNGMIEIGSQDSQLKIEVLPTATYGGTAVDESGAPVG